MDRDKGGYPIRLLPNNRQITLTPLTGGRGRLNFGLQGDMSFEVGY